MKLNEENIGKAFKEVLNNYEVQPDPMVWQNVRQLTPSQSPFTSMVAKLLYLASAVVIVGASFLYFGNDEAQIADSTNPSVEITTPNDLPADNIEATTQIETPTTSQSTTSTNKIVAEIDELVDDNQEEIATIEELPKKKDASVVDQDYMDKINSITTAQNPFPVIAPDSQQQNVSEQEANTENNTAVVAEDEITEELVAEEPAETSIPEFNPKFSDNPNICFGTDAYLVVEEGYSYTWNTGSYSNQVKVSPTRNKSYFVTVTNDLNQTAIHEFKVEIDNSCQAVVFPTAFSPNGDQDNPVFLALGHEIQDFHMQIYNREGKTVFETKDILEGWDGTYLGEKLNIGVYICRISYTDGKGTSQVVQKPITLIR